MSPSSENIASPKGQNNAAKEIANTKSSDKMEKEKGSICEIDSMIVAPALFVSDGESK